MSAPLSAGSSSSKRAPDTNSTEIGTSLRNIPPPVSADTHPSVQLEARRVLTPSTLPARGSPLSGEYSRWSLYVVPSTCNGAYLLCVRRYGGQSCPSWQRPASDVTTRLPRLTSTKKRVVRLPPFESLGRTCELHPHTVFDSLETWRTTTRSDVFARPISVGASFHIARTKVSMGDAALASAPGLILGLDLHAHPPAARIRQADQFLCQLLCPNQHIALAQTTAETRTRCDSPSNSRRSASSQAGFCGKRQP